MKTGDNSNWTAAVTGAATNPVFGSSAETAGIIYHKTDNADFAAGDDFSVTYKVYIGYDMPAGSYSGSVVYDLSVNVDEDDPVTTNYAITYDANGGDAASVPAAQSTTGSSTTALATVAEGTPTDSTYGGTFLGWSTSPEGNGRLFKAGDKITITNPNTTLYAIWRIQVTPLSGNFQDLTATACNNATTYASSYSDETTYSLTDTRDGKEYLVRKLKDDQCWMAQSLAIAYDEETSIETWNWQTKTTGSYNLPASSGVGFSENSVAYVAKSTRANGGAYYSFQAATASTGTGNSGEATTSICPKGWRLPAKDMFVNLSKAYGGTGENNDANIQYGSDFSAYIFNTALAGYYNEYSPNNASNNGSSGYYWSSTMNNSSTAYLLQISGSYGSPQFINNKRNGYSVRCVFSGQ